MGLIEKTLKNPSFKQGVLSLIIDIRISLSDQF